MSGRYRAPLHRQGLRVKLLIDKTRNRVIFAESDADFVDTLFSILTLPLGTIVRILGPSLLGSINRVYESVSVIEPRHFRTAYCKAMLLNPRNASASSCSKLKLSLTEEGVVELYSCGLWDCSDQDRFSIFEYATCREGHRMDVDSTMVEGVRAEGVDGGGDDGVFVKGSAARFMITDDLQVMAGSTASCIALLSKLGINDWEEVEQRTVEIEEEEVLSLLKYSLVSKSPLTDALLLNQGSGIEDSVKLEKKKSAQNKKTLATNSNSISMKLLISKSKKRVLYAEAGVDVIDLLFLFLTFPLGSIVKLLDRNSNLGCIDNLYKSAEELSDANYIKSEECKKMLVCPKIAPYFSFENQVIEIEEASYPPYLHNRNGKFWLATDEDASASTDGKGYIATVMDPKSPNGDTNNGEGFLKGPVMFMITENLTVTPLSPISSIAFLDHSNVALNDVEERTVTMGKEEALKLLKASLLSKTALSDVFYQRAPYPDVVLKV